MDKTTLRKKFRKTRKDIGKQQRRQYQASIVRRLKPLIKRGKKIGLYWPSGSELDIRGLLATIRLRCSTAYFPYIEKKRRRLWFTPYADGMAAIRGGWAGIPQFSGRKIRAEHLDILILPLLAADNQGVRLGQGGGFYDISLARGAVRKSKQPLRVGTGFACQFAEFDLPHEFHDIRLDIFVSEQHSIRF